MIDCQNSFVHVKDEIIEEKDSKEELIEDKLVEYSQNPKVKISWTRCLRKIQTLASNNFSSST
jgi:hypothetical protein